MTAEKGTSVQYFEYEIFCIWKTHLDQDMLVSVSKSDI